MIAPHLAAPDGPASVELRCDFDAVAGVLTLSGALDADAAATLGSVDTGGAHVRMIDARSVHLLAAAGVTALHALTQGRPTPVLASDAVRRTVECCGLTDLLQVSPTRE